MGLGVWGLGFGVSGFEFGVWGLGLFFGLGSGTLRVRVKGALTWYRAYRRWGGGGAEGYRA